MLKKKMSFCLVMTFVMVCFVRLAYCQVNNASQLINLQGSSSNGLITSFTQITHNGDIKPFVIPDGKALVIQYIYAYFKYNSVVNPGKALLFTLSPYFYYDSYVNDGTDSVAIERILPVGFAVSDSNKLQVKLTEKVGNIIPAGQFKVLIIGYLLSPLANYNGSFNLLLLSKFNHSLIENKFN